MEISIPCYISDGGALKIKQSAKHSAFLTEFLLMWWTASPQRCCLQTALKMWTLVLLIYFPHMIFVLLLWAAFWFNVERSKEKAKIIGGIVENVTLSETCEQQTEWLLFYLCFVYYKWNCSWQKKFNHFVFLFYSRIRNQYFNMRKFHS